MHIKYTLLPKNNPTSTHFKSQEEKKKTNLETGLCLQTSALLTSADLAVQQKYSILKAERLERPQRVVLNTNSTMHRAAEQNKTMVSYIFHHWADNNKTHPPLK